MILTRMICLLWMVTLSLGTAEKLFAQNMNLKKREEKVLLLETKLDSIRFDRFNLIQDAETLANQINSHRKKDLLSPSEHRNLEKKLQQSQILENQVRNVESEIEEISMEHQEAVKMLVALYQTEIDRVMQLTKTKDSQKKEKQLLRLQYLLKKKQDWETRLYPSNLPTYHDFNIDANPWNTPDELRMKGDLLLDQEESIRQTIDHIENRIHSLQEEEKVRIKVTELAHEIDLFNEREELMGRGAKIGQYRDGATDNGEETTIGFDYQGGNSYTENWSPEVGVSSLEDLKLYESGHRPKSLSGLQEWIENLKQHKKRLTTKADSLKKKADWFYNKADRR